MSETYSLSDVAAENYERLFVPALFAVWARRLVDLPDVAGAQSLLDVACGTGIVARTAAERLGPESVVGLDANPAMLAVAARVRPDMSWREGDAQALPFTDDEFDVVVSQGALMFFGDRVAALREMGRVSASGTVVVQVPGRLDHSAGYKTLAEVARRHAGPEVVDLLNGYFAVGSHDVLDESFAAAGLRIDEMTSWQSATRLDSIDSFLEVELLPLADAHEVRDSIADECRQALRPFVDPGGAIAAPIEVHLIIGRAN